MQARCKRDVLIHGCEILKSRHALFEPVGYGLSLKGHFEIQYDFKPDLSFNLGIVCFDVIHF